MFAVLGIACGDGSPQRQSPPVQARAEGGSGAAGDDSEADAGVDAGLEHAVMPPPAAGAGAAGGAAGKQGGESGAPAAHGGAGDHGTMAPPGDSSSVKRETVSPALTDLCAKPADWNANLPAGEAPPPARMGTVVRLPVDLTMASFSRVLDRFVGITGTSSLVVFDAQGHIEREVALSATSSVIMSVAASGLRAAVADASAIALIDLRTGTQARVALAGVTNLVDAGGDWIYARAPMPDDKTRRATWSIRVSSGELTPALLPSVGLDVDTFAMDAKAQHLYLGRYGTFARYDIGQGAAILESTLELQHSLSGPVWSASSKPWMFDAHGVVFRTNADATRPLDYVTTLADVNALSQITESVKHAQFAAFVGGEYRVNSSNPYAGPTYVHFYAADSFDELRTIQLPQYEENAQGAQLQGRWLSYSADESQLYVIARTPDDSSLSRRSFIVTLPAEAASDPAIPTLDDKATPYYLLNASAVDARYSRALDRIIALTTHPSQLLVLDPRTHTQAAIALERRPLYLELDPTGRRALVTVDGAVSYYDLDPLRLIRELALPASPGRPALDDANHVYLRFSSSDWRGPKLLTANLESGAVTMLDAYGATLGHYRVEDHAFYHIGSASASRTEARAGAIGSSSNAYLDFPFCSAYTDFWPDVDGRAYGGCGEVVTADAAFSYRGILAGFDGSGRGIDHLDQSAAAAMIAVVPQLAAFTAGARGDVELHEDRYLARIGTISVPTFSAAGRHVNAYPRFAFFSQDGQRLDILARARPGLGVQRDFGLISADLTHVAACPEDVPAVTQIEGGTKDGATLNTLDFDVIAAAYSRAVDRMLIASSNPPKLRFIDPKTGAVSAEVPLALAPTTLDVEPDGKHVWVGHDAWLTRVSLQDAKIVGHLKLNAQAVSIASTPDKVYVMPRYAQTTTLQVLDTASGEDREGASITADMRMRLSPDGQALLIVPARNSSDTNLYRVPLADAQKVSDITLSSLRNPVAQSVGHLFWLAGDGKRLFGELGGAYELQYPQAATFARLGGLPNTNSIRWLDQVAGSPRMAILSGPAGSLGLYDAASYTLTKSLTLPAFRSGQSDVPAQGRFVFFSNDVQSLLVLVEVNPQLAPMVPYRTRFGVVRMPVD